MPYPYVGCRCLPTSGDRICRSRNRGLAARIEAMPADARDRRACNESAIAPPNQEGFFLNMGDMLVKSGDWQTARVMYASAKSAPGYACWPFQHELEQRIADAAANVARFNAVTPPGSAPPARMMLNSTFACMACHQREPNTGRGANRAKAVASVHFLKVGPGARFTIGGVGERAGGS
jgi:hypothetical protein